MRGHSECKEGHQFKAPSRTSVVFGFGAVQMNLTLGQPAFALISTSISAYNVREVLSEATSPRKRRSSSCEYDVGHIKPELV